MNKKTLLLLCCLTSTLTSFSQARENPDSIPPREVTDKVLVRYHKEPTYANALGFIKQGVTHGGFGVAAGKRKDVLDLGSSVNINDAQTLADGLESDPQVMYAEPDFIMQTMAVPNDSRYNEQWHYFETTAGINLPTAWDITTGNPNVIVGVIDTGIVNHSDLQSNVVGGYDFISHPWIANDGSRRDADASDPGDSIGLTGACGTANGQPVPSQPTSSSWHGTHVSGTIAAVSNNGSGVAGVAWNAKIMPLRALGRCGGYTSDIIDAMRWAAGLRVYRMALNPTPVKVINMSLGGSAFGCPRSYQDAINEVVAAGVTVVVAAGNENRNAYLSTPANCSNVITVASIDRSGDRSWYSNFGYNVDIAAPGGETLYYGNGVLSAANSGLTTPVRDTFEYYQGTSMAAPHVAGVAALIYSIRPNITPSRVEDIIKSSARAFPFSSCTTSLCGAGVLDAGAALRRTQLEPN